MILAVYLADRIDRSAGPDACWPWELSTGSHGYGQAWDGQNVVLAHRLVWENQHGPIPEGLTVDHVCHNRLCCNPSHLRLLTNRENARDNGHAAKTHCPAGHPYDSVNTYIDPDNARRCRQCARNRRQARAV